MLVAGGTGSVINFVNDEDILMTDHRNYRHLLVTNNSQPADFEDRLQIYELNLEHGTGPPQTWTILQHDGPNHLGLWYNVLPEHQMALITSGCATFSHVREQR